MLNRRRVSWILGALGLVSAWLGWELLVRAGVFTELLLPAPGAVVDAGRVAFSNGSLIEDALASLQRVAVGFGIGGGLGLLLGLVLGTSEGLHALVRPLVELLRPIPGIAWIPLAILWFGIGNPASYFIVAITCFFPVFIGSYDGFCSIPGRFRDVGRNLGAGWLDTVRHIVIPGAMANILTGIRIGLGVAWATVIAAELVAATSGLGYSIALNRTLLQTPEVLVGMLCIGALGAAMTLLFDLAVRWLVPWLGWADTA